MVAMWQSIVYSVFCWKLWVKLDAEINKISDKDRSSRVYMPQACRAVVNRLHILLVSQACCNQQIVRGL